MPGQKLSTRNRGEMMTNSWTDSEVPEITKGFRTMAGHNVKYIQNIEKRFQTMLGQNVKYIQNIEKRRGRPRRHARHHIDAEM